MASTTTELVWITYLLRDIGISLHNAPQLFCDNKSALYMTINPMFHAHTKHIEIDYHFVREKVAVGALITRYIPSPHQIADIFTKSLPKLPFRLFRSKLRVHSSATSSLKKGDKHKIFPSPSLPTAPLSTKETNQNENMTTKPTKETNKVGTWQTYCTQIFPFSSSKTVASSSLLATKNSCVYIYALLYSVK